MKPTLEINYDLYRQANAGAALSGRRMKDVVNKGHIPGQNSYESPSVTVLGCLKKELKGLSISAVMNKLRGPLEN